MEKICKYCSTKFVDVEGRWFSNHVRWCDKNPRKADLTNIIKANQERTNQKYGLLKKFLVICDKCKKEFFIEEREKSFPLKSKYFCSSVCNHSRVVSDEMKIKLREKFILPRQKRLCLECNKEFECIETSKKRFCCNKCGAASRKASTEYLRYRSDCKFKFNVWDYPEEFDLDLIYKHGWYKAKNRGDNLNGVSRDHKISVKFGWENGIDPKTICHPANCQLMIHSENISKHKKCSLLLNELKEAIEKWDGIYSPIV